MIEFKNVKFTIDNTSILDDISFFVKEKTTVSLVGNKGSGKTTILKLISLVYTNYYGEILINGIESLENNSISIGYIPDEREKNNLLTVFEYLKFYAEIYNIKKELIEKEIDKYLLSHSLMSYKYTLISSLDNETYKIIDIIRVLIMNPDIMLFDNLFFSDNEEYVDKITNIIKTYNGIKTIIIAGRNMIGLETLSDYIGILDGGKLIAFGDIDNIYQKAEISRKYVVEIDGDENKAIKVLQDITDVINIFYDDNLITFSIDKSNNISPSKVLKKLIDNDIVVKSFTKERVNIDHLLGKL